MGALPNPGIKHASLELAGEFFNTETPGEPISSLHQNKFKIEPQVQSLGQEDPLEKEMTTHSSILIWEIPGTEELGGP